MLEPSLWNYSDAYILVSGTITVAALAAAGGNNSIVVVFYWLLKRNKQYTKR